MGGTSRFEPSGIVVLLTDFGERDEHVAAMKGAMLSVSASLVLVDAGHHVPPQAVDLAGWILSLYAFHYPPGSVHLVVVDPGGVRLFLIRTPRSCSLAV